MFEFGDYLHVSQMYLYNFSKLLRCSVPQMFVHNYLQRDVILKSTSSVSSFTLFSKSKISCERNLKYSTISCEYTCKLTSFQVECFKLQ